jgi:Sec-independent protein translocase protein TatA
VIPFASNRIVEFVRGLRQGIREFRKASNDLARELDQTGFDAGQSLGGIHGKAAFEALTTDNQTAELYDQDGGSEKTIKNLVRKLLIVAGGAAFCLLAYVLLKFVFLKSN